MKACLFGALSALWRFQACRALETYSIDGPPAYIPASSLVVPLRRVTARVGAHASATGAGATFYVGAVFVGHPPQEFEVLFDTSSGQVALPHHWCTSTACVERHRYSPSASRSAMDVNADGSPVVQGQRLASGRVKRDMLNVQLTQADLGEGEMNGVLVRDHVCIGLTGDQACAEVAMVAATKMQDVPFQAMPHDGIVGLGHEGLSASSGISFLGRLFARNKGMVAQFGIFLGNASGELYIGGHNDARTTEPLRWFAVAHPEDGFWQVEIKTVRVGNLTVDTCQGGCRGIVDTSASQLGVQAKKVGKLRKYLAPVTSCGYACCQGPSLEFDLGGMALVLRPADIADDACTPQLASLDLDEPQFAGVYAFGAKVLRHYYVAFDWEARRLGFAPAAAEQGEEEKAQASLGTVFV